MPVQLTVQLIDDPNRLAPWAKGHLRNVPQAGSDNDNGRPVVFKMPDADDSDQRLGFLDRDNTLWPTLVCAKCDLVCVQVWFIIWCHLYQHVGDMV